MNGVCIMITAGSSAPLVDPVTGQAPAGPNGEQAVLAPTDTVIAIPSAAAEVKVTTLFILIWLCLDETAKRLQKLNKQ